MSTTTTTSAQLPSVEELKTMLETLAVKYRVQSGDGVMATKLRSIQTLKENLEERIRRAEAEHESNMHQLQRRRANEFIKKRAIESEKAQHENHVNSIRESTLASIRAIEKI